MYNICPTRMLGDNDLCMKVIIVYLKRLMSTVLKLKQ